MFNDHDDDDDDDWNIWQKHDISDVWWAPTQPAMWPRWGIYFCWSGFSSISGWKSFLFIFASFYCENSVFLIFSKTITLMQFRLRWIMNNQNGCLLSPRFETGQWTVSIGHPHYALCTSLYSVAKTTWYDFPCQKLDDEMLSYRSALKRWRFQKISGDDCWKITKGWKEYCCLYDGVMNGLVCDARMF